MPSNYQGIRAPKYRRLRNGAKTLIDGMPVGPLTQGNVWWVDGTSGSANADGKAPDDAFNTITLALSKAGNHDVIYVLPKLITDTTGDPASYAETLTITQNHLSLIGVSRGLTQGGLPQIKKGSGSTALLTIRGAGCLIAGLGFNGASSTGGGILLDDDYSTKYAFGTTIMDCHFKNCKGSTATDASTGGAIMWSNQGNAWQCRIEGNRFYSNVGDVVLLGTLNTDPKDVVIINNIFTQEAAAADCNVFAASSGWKGVTIAHNIFPAFPAKGSAANARFVKLGAGTTGILAGNYFAEDKTFGAAGTGGIVPTTVLLSGNYDEGGLVARV